MYISKLRLLLLVSLLSIMAACSSNSVSEDSQGSDEAVKEDQNTNKVAFSPNIYFAFDRSTIQSAQATVLDMQVDKIKKEGIKTITIEGHADSIGTTVYNIALGERRANATKKYLGQKGIDANSIKIVSYGKGKPMASNDTAEGRAKNRRTVTLFK